MSYINIKNNRNPLTAKHSKLAQRAQRISRYMFFLCDLGF
jgi:hypothetical protein